MGKNEKLQHRWSILCRESSIDSQTNNISLFNILEQVGIDAEVFAEKKGGAIPMNLELVTLWEKQVEEEGVDAEVEVELQEPDGKPLGKFPYTISVPKRRHRHLVKLNGLPVTEKSGRYTFKIRKREGGESKFVEVGEVPVEINIRYVLRKQREKARKIQ